MSKEKLSEWDHEVQENASSEEIHDGLVEGIRDTPASATEVVCKWNNKKWHWKYIAFKYNED